MPTQDISQLKNVRIYFNADDQCAICRDPITNPGSMIMQGIVTVYSCGHVMHKHCANMMIGCRSVKPIQNYP